MEGNIREDRKSLRETRQYTKRYTISYTIARIVRTLNLNFIEGHLISDKFISEKFIE
jgi:hypothetical protein